MAVVARSNPNLALVDCLASDGIGSMVYVTGPVSDGKYQVASCDPSDFGKMPAIGMLIEKVSSTVGVIQFRGVIDSVYAGLTPGELLFVDDAGGLSDVPPEPTAGSPYKFMQNAGAALSEGAINLNPNFMMARRRL